MGRAARRRVEREFTWDIVAMRTAALYETVLAERACEEELLKSLIGARSRAQENNLGGLDHGAR